MNATQARKKSLKNIEAQLWSQLRGGTQIAIEEAVREELQRVSIAIKWFKKKSELNKEKDILKQLGYNVSDDSQDDRGIIVPAKNIHISW